jgi:hypothetical protein
MNVTCQDRERIFMDGSPEEWTALDVHAVNCVECGEQLRVWKSMSVAAGEMRQEWETPYLWTRIEHALTEQIAERPSRFGMWLNSLGLAGFHWQTAAALALLIVVSGTSVWVYFHRDRGPGDKQVFLRNSAVNEVERAEAEYEKAIDKLDRQARLQLDPPTTPLMASYREKLLVLDNAIEELRREAGHNTSKAHMNLELLFIYT